MLYVCMLLRTTVSMFVRFVVENFHFYFVYSKFHYTYRQTGSKFIIIAGSNYYIKAFHKIKNY